MTITRAQFLAVVNLIYVFRKLYNIPKETFNLPVNIIDP